MRQREKEQAMAYLEKTKADAMQFYNEACEDAERWGVIVNDCEDEMKEIGQVRCTGSAHTRVMMALIIITVLVLVSIVLCSCGTVDGMRKDIHNLTRSPYTQEME